MSKGRLILTGGSRGIGRAIVEAFSAANFDVAFGFHKNEAEAAELSRRVADRHGSKCLAIAMDASGQESCKRFADSALSALGGLDVLINNAGIIIDRGLATMEAGEWEKVLRTNLDGVFHVTRSVVLELLKQKSGSILNVTSVSGMRGSAGQTNYSASKAGIIGFTQSLALECAPRKVRVNAIAPGFIETDMTTGFGGKQREDLLRRIPLGRFGKAEEVASLALYLSSEAASYITGQVFVVDGGLTA